MNKGTKKLEILRRESEVNHVLTWFLGERMKIDSKEPRIDEDGISCPIESKGGICINDDEIYNQVCNGNYQLCLRYIVIKMEQGISEDLENYRRLI